MRQNTEKDATASDVEAIVSASFTGEFTLDGEKRKVTLGCGSTVIHPEGFEMKIHQIEGEYLILEDSDGYAKVHQSEVGCMVDDFYEGEVVNEH